MTSSTVRDKMFRALDVLRDYESQGMTLERNVMFELSTCLLSRLGLALVMCQLIEKQLDTCLRWALQGEEPMSLDRLMGLQKKYRTATLGRFIESLQRTFDVESTFKHLLDDFLKHRNQLVHDLVRMPDFDISSVKGIHYGLRLACQICDEGWLISQVLQPIIQRWATSYDFKEFNAFAQYLLGEWSKQTYPLQAYIDKIIRAKGREVN